MEDKDKEKQKEEEDEEHKAEAENEEVGRLVEAMRNLKDGVVIKKRKYLLSSYPKCFVGKEAVSWFVTKGFASTREEAVELGEMLRQQGVFHHVLDDHTFKDEHLFYRFFCDESDFAGNLQELSSWAHFLPQEGGDSGKNKDDLQPSLPPQDEDLLASFINLEVSPPDEHNIKLLDNVHPAVWQDPTPSGVYNMVVIGAGAGGLVTAVGSAGLGAKVALIEEHLLGGDCLNVGCVPSKALIRAARAVANVKNAQEFGVKINGTVEVDFAAIMERMRKLRAQISPNDSAKRLADLKVDVYFGRARFTGKDTIEVNGNTLKFAKACIATGGRAAIPPVPGLHLAGFLTNENIFNLTALPKRLAVIGAGAIGCELAQSFARFGSETTLIYRGEHIMPREDPDAVVRIEAAFRKDGIRLCAKTQLHSVEISGSDKVLRVTVDGQDEVILVDEILVATGRLPNVEGLGLKIAGIKYDTKRGIQVNDHLQTSNTNVFAVGDVCTEYKFTHMSDAMARIVIRNALFFGRASVKTLTIPWCTYTDPEIAHVGLYERDCNDKGIKCRVFTKEFSHLDRAILDGEEEGFARVITRDGSDKILGATIVASHAGDMISELTLAMVTKTGMATIAATIHPYPTQAEAIRQLGDEYNRTKLTPTVKVFFRNLLKARR